MTLIDAVSKALCALTYEQKIEPSKKDIETIIEIVHKLSGSKLSSDEVIRLAKSHARGQK